MNGSSPSSRLCLNASSSGSTAVTYNNEPTMCDNYLTPTSPDRVLSSLPVFLPSKFDRSQSVLQDARIDTSFNRSTSQLLPRADSGIGSDYYPGSPLSSSSTSQRQSTVYEYIDSKHVRLSERYAQMDNFNSSGTSSASTRASELSTTYHGDVGHDSDDASLTDPARRRMNPLYGVLEKSATQLYTRPTYNQHQAATKRQLCCLWCAVIVSVVIATILLAIVTYILFWLIPGLKSNIDRQDYKIRRLEANLTAIGLEGKPLHGFLAENQSSSDAGLALSLLTSVSQLNVTVWSLHSDWTRLYAGLQRQISNITLTPGPPGKNGAGNLNKCSYSNSSSSMYLPAPVLHTSWEPSGQTLQSKIVMFASCSVESGTEQSIETNVISTNTIQYRCRCDGQKLAGDLGLRRCTLHLLMCDRFSVATEGADS